MAQCSVLWLVAVCCSEVWPGVVMWGVVYHCVGVYAVLCVAQFRSIQNTVVQSIELQGNRCGTGRDARIAATLE